MTTKPAPKGPYIETDTGNKISRASKILGAKHIVLSGKCVIRENVVIRGDLVRPPESRAGDSGTASSSQASKKVESNSVHFGRYVYVSPDCVIRPPSRLSTQAKAGQEPEASLTYFPLRIHDYVYIGPKSVVQAAEIRSNVYIGANVSIGNSAIIRENVKVLDGAVLPPNSVWASNSIVGGVPARVIGDLTEAWGSGSSSATSLGGWEEMIGVRARERWASVSNNKK